MSTGQAYDSLYREFDSALARQIRLEAYGEDIGQHSWVTGDELRADISGLDLSRSSRLLDLGCGPGGPLTFVLRAIGCLGTGIEISGSAVSFARAKAMSLGVDHLATFREGDLNQALPFGPSAFDAAMSLDVMPHLTDRAVLFREVARVLTPGGKFLVTDACVLTGSISDEEIALRSMHGRTHVVAPGRNEQLLEHAGFRLLQTKDRTPSVLSTAAGRHTARLAHRTELEQLEGSTYFERYQRYLDTVIELSRRKALSRMAYLAESRVA
jgi:cyclopropane fatty-acyl-phospholipid synthase-like methyltransferase